jgi:hypothetical protein
LTLPYGHPTEPQDGRLQSIPDSRPRAHRAAPLASLASLLAALVLAGCAAPRPPPRPALTPSPSVVPAFPVPSARERMVFLARQEWALFGSPLARGGNRGNRGIDGNGGTSGGTAGIANGGSVSRLEFPDPSRTSHELQGPMLTRVMMYWYTVSAAPIVGTAGELRPWSAAFMSWIARAAGYAPAQFPATVLHWDYIERFLNPGPDDRFATRDPLQYAPRVGDLVCNARGGTAAALRPAEGLRGLRRGPYHCELVVGGDGAALETIGGNVGDAVALSRVPIDAQGRLLPQSGSPWAAVIEHRLPGAAAADGPPPRGPQGAM